MEQNPLFHEQIRLERERRGWSQADLAEKAGCDPKTVGRWESGERIPRPYHRQVLYELFGKDAEAFGLIGSMPRSLATAGSQTLSGVHKTGEDVPSAARCEDWHEAPVVTSLYGREKECNELELWLQDQSCRVIPVTGMGGIGKTSLVVAAATHVKEQFECIIWRSLRAAPPVELLLKQCLGQLSRQSPIEIPDRVDELQLLLLDYLRAQRCLLILDHLEAIMQPGQRAGCYREGYAGYGELIRLFTKARHRSCLLLTSREKPKEVACLEGLSPVVRARSLAGIGLAGGRELLKERGLFGLKKDWAALVERYSGNPLALQYASVSVREIFGGNIARFLQENVSAFGEISELLGQHFQRLTDEEREILYWLAIEREPLPFDALRENLAWSMSLPTLLELLDSLRGRSIIETRGTAQFVLQTVFKDYVTGCLMERAYQEFMAKIPGVWMSHALNRAKSRGYTRENQPVALLVPVAQRLLATLGKKGVEQRAKNLLAAQCHQALYDHDYLTTNIISLLNHAGCSLPGQTGRGKLAVLSSDHGLLAIHSENGLVHELVAAES